jgi:hypothetical protein
MWHFVKTIYSHKFDYKMVLNYKCNYDLQLLLVCMKMKMKSAFISFIIGDVQQWTIFLFYIVGNVVYK